MIDCLDESFEDSVAFWSEALGLKPRRGPKAGQRYLTLGKIDGPLFVRLQRVESDPGFHLDIETGSIPKEVARLEKAGGRRKCRVKRWWVMEDPSGNPYCVISPESDEFPRNARQWEE